MPRPYQLASRPLDTEHGHPILIYDCNSQLHYPLTRFAKFASESRTIGTVKGYLYVLLPFFAWLDTDAYQLKNQRHWHDPPEQVRWVVEEYLAQQMQCQVQEHTQGFYLVYRTAKTPTEIRTFLTALKCFYKLMRREGFYLHPNPLIDSSAENLLVDTQLETGQHPPQMPDISGVEKPRSRKRLTDSYYKLEGDEWIPNIIDDPDFPTRLLIAGRQLSNWKLREECVTRLLFESGGRISEVVGLTLDDWFKRGLNQEANIFSKRSRGRRVKFLRFSVDTAKLLRRYFNEERILYDSAHYTLDNYLEQARGCVTDLQEVPLFLTLQHRQLTPQNYRDNYWKPACKVAGIEADIHQARHWYVTNAMRRIYETAAGEGEVERLKRSLKAYMKWKSDDTIAAYDHYFDSLANAKLQNDVHARLDLDLHRRIEALEKGEVSPYRVSCLPAAELPEAAGIEDENFDYLKQIGG